MEVAYFENFAYIGCNGIKQNTINMKMNQIISTIILFCGLIFTLPVQAQMEIAEIQTINLNGPRLGMTYIGPGEFADRLDNDFGVSPFITQFGWQLETRFFTLPNGVGGVIEAIGLIGGLEQNVFLPSASVLIGLRGARGFEFGVGPNLSLAGAALVIAGGITLQTNNINFPINFAVVPSNKGVRISILFGFNARSSKAINLFQ
jgi:hypothetical protein